MSHGILNAMLVALLAALVVQLPFGGSPVLFTAAGVPVSLRALTAVAALATAGWRAWTRTTRLDLLGWALLAYASAWLVAALAAPWDFPASLRAALGPAGAALLALCLRSAFPARDRQSRLRPLLAGAALAAGLLAVGLAGRTVSPVSRADLAAAARLAFTQHPVFGWGPGQFREFTPRWLKTSPPDAALDPPDLYRHHLTDGGVVTTAALVLLVAAALAVLSGRGDPWSFGRRRNSRRADPTARIGVAALALWLGWGLVASPLLMAGPMLAVMLALGLAAPGVK